MEKMKILLDKIQPVSLAISLLLLFSLQGCKYYYKVQTVNNDPSICNLQNIEKMQNWTITENNKEIFLAGTDICGGAHSYKIEYSNYQYAKDLSGVHKNYIDWDMSLVNQDTTITCNDINFKTDSEPLYMSFTVNALNVQYYTVYRGHIDFSLEDNYNNMALNEINIG